MRSCFDLYFQVRGYEAGSEVLMTGLNIPDMVRIVKEHGLVPIPVVISLETLKPKVEDILRCISPRTKAIVIAYVHGVTYDCTYIAEALKGTGIEILEDCAQSFRSIYAFRGSSHAAMSMFSFGTIKHNSAGAGAVTIFRQSAER